jgi:hypothetical protein
MMAYQTYTRKITGVIPMLMHSGMLADPSNPIVQMMKKISGKRDKTESDYIEMSRLEWYGGLYVDNGRPCIPGEVIEACLLEAARKSRKGKQAQAGIMVPDNAILIYDGPQNIDEMWESGQFIHKAGVKIQRNKVIRTRPVFKNWSAVITIHYLPGLLNESDVKTFLEVAGQIVGLGDWRPKFGRFVVEPAQVVEQPAPAVPEISMVPLI